MQPFSSYSTQRHCEKKTKETKGKLEEKERKLINSVFSPHVLFVSTSTGRSHLADLDNVVADDQKESKKKKRRDEPRRDETHLDEPESENEKMDGSDDDYGKENIVAGQQRVG